MLGQTLTGNVIFVDDTTDHVIAMAVSGLTLSLGNGSTTFVSATAAGDLVLTPAGVAGSLSVSAITTPGIPSSVLSFTGTITVSVNETGQAVNETFANGFAPLNLAAGTYIRVDVGSDAAPASLTVFGQTITAHAFFVQTRNSGGDAVVALGLDQGSLTLGTAADGVSVTGANGWLIITAQGVAGSLSAQASVALGGILHLSAQVTVDVNTTNAAISQTFPGGSGAPQSFTLDAGPFLRVALLNATATIAGNSLTGNFYFEHATESDGTVETVIAVSDLKDSAAQLHRLRGAALQRLRQRGRRPRGHGHGGHRRADHRRRRSR